MTLPTPLTMMGAPGSPYTRKMRALLRYRGIPYRLIHQFSREHEGRPRPKVPLLPTFYLPGEDGVEVAVTDSTPLIRRFEAEFPGRSVIPPSPVLAFLDYLLEDYADEWLTRPMYHYRWAYAADIAKASRVIPMWGRVDLPEAKLDALQKYVAERQISRRGVVGSSDTTADFIEESYRRFLRLFDAHLQRHPFLFGARPSAADFAIMGQLTCLALFDPTPAAVTLEESPRVYAWVEKLEDLSGFEPRDDDWIGPNELPETLEALLAEVGRVHIPFLVANAAAIEGGSDLVETTLDGQPWTQKPFRYQAKCLRSLREEWARLDDEDRRDAAGVLSSTGCGALLSD